MAEPPANLDEASEKDSHKELALSEVFLIELSILIASFIAGRALERIRFKWMGEAGAALLLGLLVGLIMKLASVVHDLATMVEFKGDIFFYILLPTIMFDAGYGMDAKIFCRNVGSVCLFAFAGTTISCFIVGVIMWGFGQAGWCEKLTLLENLTFGALISATDPVTVLAVFQRLNAQEDLYINVFGESVLNDAVGLVLYNVITEFLDGKAVTGPNVLAGIGIFFGIFAGSMAIGLAVGFIAAIIFRSRFLYSDEVVDLKSGKVLVPKGNSLFEVGCAIIFAYSAYLIADVAHCSGIVAVVTNGVVMKLYVRPNLSHEAEIKVEMFFKTLAALFELFVFCYIGSTLFLGHQHYSVWSYTALCLIALAVSRFANIYPLSLLTNVLRPKERRITQKEQVLMWWSGLRGAMAFALAVKASEDYGKAGEVMKTTCFYIIFITVLVNGGGAAYLLEVLHLRACDPPPNKYAAAAAAAEQATLVTLSSSGPKGGDNGGEGRTNEATCPDGSSSGAVQDGKTPNLTLVQELEQISGDLAKGRFARVSKSLADVGRAGAGAGGVRAVMGVATSPGTEPQSGVPRVLSAPIVGVSSSDSLRCQSERGAAREWSIISRGVTGALAPVSSALKRVQGLNDGRLVDWFGNLNRRLSRYLVYQGSITGRGTSSSCHTSTIAPASPATAPAASAAAVTTPPVADLPNAPPAGAAYDNGDFRPASSGPVATAWGEGYGTSPGARPHRSARASPSGGPNTATRSGDEISATPTGSSQASDDMQLPLPPEQIVVGPAPPLLERITSETGVPAGGSQRCWSCGSSRVIPS